VVRVIALRAATPDDAQALLGIYGPYVVTNAVSFETVPPSLKEMRARIAGSIATHPWIVATDAATGLVLGYAFAKPWRAGPAYRFTAETACYVAGEMEGQGYRRTLYAALIATLIAQNYTQAISTLTMPQDKAIQLHEALGFKRAGFYREVCHKNGQWVDVGIWQRELAEPATPPDEPLPFADVGVMRG
jgi:L-amino acid N-acyltransferase YncA